MGNLKKFIGEYAYNTVKNIAVDEDRIRQALVTPQNARAVFSELTEFEIKSLCAEISNSETIDQIRETTQQEIYDCIVNIGGVYLKYHTEKNNVYFGAFVLDGDNGVRYSDTSRYYVTKVVNAFPYYEHPLVLDFQDKKAIDVLGKEVNKKASLLSRAMQEGLLTNANKETSDTLTAVFCDAKKELLQANKKALQYVHETYGYDFTKPYTVTGMLGNFTAKSIEKITGSNTGILLVCLGDEMTVCEMNNGRFNTKYIKSSYENGIDTYYRQGDFEAERKSGKVAVYVIQQDKQYIGNPKTKKARLPYYKSRDIDKSGFNITEARRELYCRLKEYKSEKRAREAAEIDYTHDIVEIAESFAELKREIIKLLERADTVKEYDIIAKTFDWKFTWLVRDIKEVEEHAANKTFLSVESAYESINDIKECIKVKAKLVYLKEWNYGVYSRWRYI